MASAAEDYGADRMLLHSVRALTGDHRVTVIVPTEGPLRPRLEAEGATVQVHRDYALRRRYLSLSRVAGLLFRNLRSAGRLVALHRRDPIDLIVTNTEAVVLGGVTAWAIGRPHVWHVHEIVDEPQRFARLMAMLIHRLTDRVIACSGAVRDHLVALRPDLGPRITVVANAVPVPSSRPSPPVTPDAVLRVGCIGRIHPRKGQRQLVEAWATLAVRTDLPLPRLELHFFGEPLPGDDHLVDQLRERLDDAGCGQDVHFHGFVGNPDDIYPGLDLVVVPSVEPESFSLVCAEAQAHGIAVIGPDRGGPTETVRAGSTGLSVDPTDIDALVAAMARLLTNDAERRSFGAAGRRWSSDAFSLGRYQGEIRSVVAATLLGTAPVIRVPVRTVRTGSRSATPASATRR